MILKEGILIRNCSTGGLLELKKFDSWRVWQEDILSGKQKINDVEFESCKSSLIFEVIDEEKTPGDASHESMMSYFRGVSKDYHK